MGLTKIEIPEHCLQLTYQAASNAACGLGAWGAAESEMEMWYAL